MSSEHSLMDDSMEGRPLTPALRGTYRVLERLASHTVAVSATTAQRLQRWGVDPQRVTVVDNGIDVDALRFDPAARAAVRAELGVDDDTLVVGAVGRLEPVKRMDQVLRAAALLLRDRGAVLVVAGSGSLAAPLAEPGAQPGRRGPGALAGVAIGRRGRAVGDGRAGERLARRDLRHGGGGGPGGRAARRLRRVPRAGGACRPRSPPPSRCPSLDDDDEQVAALGRVLAQPGRRGGGPRAAAAPRRPRAAQPLRRAAGRRPRRRGLPQPDRRVTTRPLPHAR
nr:glycosyltransferase [Angustibacter aerolatus]